MTNLTNVIFIHNFNRNNNSFTKFVNCGCLYSFTIGTIKDDGKLPLSNLTIKINNTILDIYNEYNEFNTGNIEYKLSDFKYDKNKIDIFEIQYIYNNDYDIECYLILNILHDFSSLGEKKKTELLDIKRKPIKNY